jgi:hypothetical protein
VWCTDWNAFSGAQVAEITADSFVAPLETTAAAFTDSPTPYPNTTARTGHPGCTPGVSPPTP